MDARRLAGMAVAGLEVGGHVRGHRTDGPTEAPPGPDVAEDPRLDVLGRPAEAASVGLVSGSFDPMTIAHAALADALPAELVLLVVSPATLPKEPGAEPPLLDLEARVTSLSRYVAARRGMRVAVSSHGLYADQVGAASRRFPGASIVVGLGSDKVGQLFDPAFYGDRDEALERLFSRAEVRYAMRAGDEDRVHAVLEAEPRWAPRIARLDLSPEIAAVSSGNVRRAVRRGQDVRALVPEEIIPFLPGA